MGANCCVAARDKPLPLPSRISCEVSNYRNIRHSPSWSFRWDNRTHIEDIMDDPSRFSHHHSGNIGSESKSAADTENEGQSDGGSPAYGLLTPKWRKNAGITGSSKSLIADQSPKSNSSSQEKATLKSSSQASASDTKPAFSVPSTPSPTSSFKTLPDPSSSTGCSLQSDAWSMRTFSELVAASSQKERYSLDSIYSDAQTCRICSKLLKDKSPYGSQKIVSTNELSVSAVLICGHVYHAECLENITSEIDRYDPPCPLCTNGEKMIAKLLGKPKISKQAVADIDVDLKWGGKSPSMGASSGVKRPFLKRHFSIGSRSVSENEAMRKKKGFWGRYR